MGKREKNKKFIYIYTFLNFLNFFYFFFFNFVVVIFTKLKHCKEVHYKGLFKID